MTAYRIWHTCLWTCILTLLAVEGGGQRRHSVSVSDITTHLPAIIHEAKILAYRRLERETQIALQMRDVVDSSPFSYVYNFFKSHPYTRELSRSAVTSLIALRLIRLKFGLTGEEAIETLRDAHISGILRPLQGVFYADSAMPITPDIDYCPYPSEMKCYATNHHHLSWIRSVDGSCNNRKRPIIGRSMTPFRRLLPAHYHDGIEEFRQSVTGRPLPGARFLSYHLFQDMHRPSLETTMMFVFFGQFTDHDLTRTAATLVPNPSEEGPMIEIKCGDDGCLHGVEGLEACAPIPVSIDDADFASYNRCLKFIRNVEVPNIDCEPSAREQLNQVTHWLDGSEIYGSSKRELDLLRDFSDPNRGALAVVSHPHRLKPLLPREVVVGEPSMCKNVNATVHCFQAGDPRVNENAGLGTIHTLFVRYHNVIEEHLSELNSHWSGERLFLETRRIVVASLQHITYNEWLPLLLGPQIIAKFELDLKAEGYYEGYNDALDGRIPNEFATAAFRIGHTLLQERLRRSNDEYQFDDSLFLSQTFNRPEHLYNTQMGGIDAFIRGLSHEPSQTFDHFFTKQITRSLFAERPPHGLGHDLLSLNIQRGRDHGLSPYNDYRELCGLSRATTFEDLSSEITDEKHIHTLSLLYRSVDDIDLFVGGVSEESVPGGITGPTLSCIIANTFRNLRRADRMWYENQQNGFTPDQLQEIRKITMAKILCTNGDDISHIQPYAFLQPGKKPTFYKSNSNGLFNVPVTCESLPNIDLREWRVGPFTA